MDLRNIKFEKIDLSFEPEPNTAMPKVEVLENGIVLSFPTESFDGKLFFEDCLIYRVGDPNDEGFYLFGADSRYVNNSIYCKRNFPDLEFDAFYVVEGVNWKDNLLGKGTQILDPSYSDKNAYIHYLFFMKEGTVECVAKSYVVLSDGIRL